MNNEKLRSMLENHPEYSTPEYSTTARSCVFDISQPSSDLFLVVKLEKVLQVSYFNSLFRTNSVLYFKYIVLVDGAVKKTINSRKNVRWSRSKDFEFMFEFHF